MRGAALILHEAQDREAVAGQSLKNKKKQISLMYTIPDKCTHRIGEGNGALQTAKFQIIR